MLTKITIIYQTNIDISAEVLLTSKLCSSKLVWLVQRISV